MIAAMTADNATVTSKLDSIMAENARMRAEAKSMKSTMEAMKKRQNTSATAVKGETGKTETALNSSGEHCPIEPGHGPLAKYWFFQDKQYCANCKKMVKHQPIYCPELPERKKRKAEVLAEVARRKASK